MKREKPADEIIARALCRHAGNPEDIIHQGAPLWESYLPEAQAVLKSLEEHGFHLLGRTSKM
ncbi:hypothetical protein [Mesorhizobium sp. GR13]|uniref:hypothetical protein n=1 Tax=Mesorhizobium sp. GR13 TaxID=2562308 RepID=UPI0010C06B8B|nr:hypothetical protein [Mesorhizobium sp. GR13]